MLAVQKLHVRKWAWWLNRMHLNDRYTTGNRYNILGIAEEEKLDNMIRSDVETVATVAIEIMVDHAWDKDSHQNETKNIEIELRVVDDSEYIMNNYQLCSFCQCIKCQMAQDIC